MKHNFYSDAAHGWLRTTIDELIDLDIVDKISEYSYMDRYANYVYLEEDSDATVFIEAYKEANGQIPELNYVYSERSSIRSYAHYNAGFVNWLNGA